jgi:hypothetical protein
MIQMITHICCYHLPSSSPPHQRPRASNSSPSPLHAQPSAPDREAWILTRIQTRYTAVAGAATAPRGAPHAAGPATSPSMSSKACHSQPQSLAPGQALQVAKPQHPLHLPRNQQPSRRLAQPSSKQSLPHHSSSSRHRQCNRHSKAQGCAHGLHTRL